MFKGLLYKGILGGVVLSLAGCLTDQVADQGTTADIQPPSPDTYVCNPFGDGAQAPREQGVHGSLFYVEPGGPQYPTVSEYITNATPVDVDLFFNQIYVPTRPFDRGFVTQSGQSITSADGTLLYEWFAIKFNGRLQLGPNDAPGPYQLAVLSDDGSMLSMEESGTSRLVVADDGWHPTRMGCAAEPVSLAAGDKLPFELNYFQGPRYHIAVIMMWRPWPASDADVADPACGRQGNSLWFDYTQDPPMPTSTYTSLLSRGWKVIGPENFLLPEKQGPNPCNEPAPVLSDVAVVDVAAASAAVTWTTDRQATSQIVLTEIGTGAVTTSPEDTTYVTAHRVVAAGLKANTLYSVKAISKSISGRSSESAVLSFRTKRF